MFFIIYLHIFHNVQNVYKKRYAVEMLCIFTWTNIEYGTSHHIIALVSALNHCNLHFSERATSNYEILITTIQYSKQVINNHWNICMHMLYWTLLWIQTLKQVCQLTGPFVLNGHIYLIRTEMRASHVFDRVIASPIWMPGGR